ncbi:MAG TPA: hypothetical protein VKD72_04750 [Gemmataceae bacterium]|nr:hypothetical protein [Gemmataceae bacterium]
MKRLRLHPPARALLLLGLLLAGVGAPRAANEPPRPRRDGEEEAHRAQLEQLRKLTTQELEQFFRDKNPQQVRELLGPPQRIARQIFSQGRLEQWVYEDVCRVVFHTPLGMEAHFQSVHSLSRRNR